MARILRILGTAVSGVIVAIQFPKVLESPSRFLVLCLAATVVACFVIAEIFLHFEEKKREQRQEQRQEQLIRSVMEEFASTSAAKAPLPSIPTELGMSADDPRIYVEV